MALLEDLADALAHDVMAAQVEIGNDRLFMDVGKVLGTSSPSLQEAFLTSCRLRMAEQRGRKFLEDTLRAARGGGKTPYVPTDRDLPGSSP
ncbi:MAG: hypothetical protein ACOY4T_14680 [Pseudomonadota bacterium]|jgi:hypothetical protein